jgi:hypothetical protein
MLLKSRYNLYVIFAALAALTRESYVLIAFVFFIMNFLGFFKKEDKFNIKIATKFAIPGICFLISSLYINIKLHDLYPYSDSINVIKQGMMNWPFLEFFKYFYLRLAKPNSQEFTFLIIYILSLILTTISSYKALKKENKFFAFIPLVLLFAAFGKTVMEHFSGYIKGISILFAILPLSFIYIPNYKQFKKIVTIFLIMSTVYGYYKGFYKEKIGNGWHYIPVGISPNTSKEDIRLLFSNIPFTRNYNVVN